MQTNRSVIFVGNLLKRAVLVTPCWAAHSSVSKESTTVPTEKVKYHKDGAVSDFKKVLSHVPQSVVVVTGAKYDAKTETWHKRGATCSSFTGISLDPTCISFAMKRPSRLHDLLQDTQRFAVHVLAEDQVSCGLHFSRPCPEDKDQFEGIKHELDKDGVPIIKDVSVVLHCKFHSVNNLGDHHVCYGEVMNAYTNGGAKEPLIYYQRAFRSIGDELFMKVFEDTSFPFEDWTHEAHVRMAYNYLSQHNKEEATPLIIEGILRYNEKNKEKITRGYNETITLFFTHIIDYQMQLPENQGLAFDDFISKNRFMMENDFISKYYNWETVTSKVAQSTWVPPDKRPLP